MASVRFPALILIVATCAALLVSPTHSVTCNSQKFPSNKTFTNCTDLTELDSQIHFTYNSSNSSLSIAFTAAPAKPEGWVSWAINPTSTGMAGAQALIAFKRNGSLTTKTYNISSYSSILESKLSFDVWDLSSESDGEKIVIYASVKVPENVEKLNHVWQVGPSVSDAGPAKHEMQEANLKSEGTLQLVASSDTSDSPAPTPPRPADRKGDASRNGNWNLAMAIALIILGFGF